jgi:hypothetical protein
MLTRLPRPNTTKTMNILRYPLRSLIHPPARTLSRARRPYSRARKRAARVSVLSAIFLLRPPNTGDKLRSGARVRPSRRGHEAACPSWQPCRRKLRQLHPLVRRHRTHHLVSYSREDLYDAPVDCGDEPNADARGDTYDDRY